MIINMVVYSGFTATVGIGIAAAVGVAILAGGPWGLLAMGVAIAVCGLIMAAASYNINRNTRFLEDVQYKAVTKFAQDLVGGASDVGINLDDSPGANPAR